MTDYSELVKALRIHASVDIECYECAYHDDCCTNGNGHTKMMTDAAAAIEELQAEQKKTVTQIFCEEQHEWEEYCTGLMNRIRELKAQLPKRGEWIDSKERMRPDMCSVCGCVYEADRFMDKIAWNYCPNCGAKMEVQDEA